MPERRNESSAAQGHKIGPDAPPRLCSFDRCTFPSPCPDHEMSAEMREVFAAAGHRCSPKCLVPLTWQANEHATALLTAKIKVRRG